MYHARISSESGIISPAIDGEVEQATTYTSRNDQVLHARTNESFTHLTNRHVVACGPSHRHHDEYARAHIIYKYIYDNSSRRVLATIDYSSTQAMEQCRDERLLEMFS